MSGRVPDSLMLSLLSDDPKEEVRARIEQLAHGWLESAEQWWPDGFRVREIGIVWAVDLPEDKENVSISCSEDRAWARAGLFRAAMQVAEERDDGA